MAAASPATAADVITFRASAEVAFNQTTARAVIPSSVREGDGLLLFVTTNVAVSSGTTAPAGWTLEGRRLSGNDTETSFYSKVAVANDAGRNAALTFPQTVKGTLNLLAYDGTGADPVATFASAAETTNRAAHTTPGANVAATGSYVVSYWADKSSTTTTWTLPSAQTRRSVAVGTGTGRITAVASDPGVGATAGAAAGVTATSDGSTAKATMWSIVLQPDEAASPNVAPVASFAVSCPTATCTVDGSASSDTPPGSIASYAWDFGDGTTGTGVTTTHTYTSGGAKTVTLIVTDNQGLASAPATRTASPVISAPTGGTQPVPGHTRLVPDVPRNNMPRISTGEIWDIEVVPQLNRVFIAGNFTSIQNNNGTNTTTYNQAGLASYNYQTGLVDAQFRPTFNGGVAAVEASPDGTKLFVAGSFNTVNGVAKQKVASLNLTTGAPLTTFGFTNSTNNQVQSLAATNSTLYVGGRFTRINGVQKTGLAAVDAASGVVDTAFDNNLSGGIGTNGQLGVPQLKLTHDNSKLLVVHTGRQVDGQDRLGMAIIDTASKQLLPWRARLWDENLSRVGGVTRICCADIAPDDSYFVVSSGSGGDAPPISDTAVRYDLDQASLQNDDVQPVWIERQFDSIYSVAITEKAVYVGGHFQFVESPESCPTEPCYPGLENVGYGTGQGLAGYGLGDAVVRRDHLAALDPATGRAAEWNPLEGSNSYEGNKAMEATSRGLFIGGDGMQQGGVRTGRVAFYDLNSVVSPAALPDTTITTPIEGRVVTNNVPFDITGTARVATGSVGRVQVSVRDRNSGQYLQDNGTAFTTFGNTSNTLNATLSGTGTTRTWSIPATISSNRNLIVTAQAFTAATGGTGDSTSATKKFESFSIDDQTPSTAITGPSNSILTSSTFTITGTATDDKGINSITFYFRDAQGRYLQSDGTVDDIYNSFRGQPDVIGATSATWSYDVTLPHDGEWMVGANAVDTAGQSDLRAATRTWRIDPNAVAPSVTIEQPAPMTPPFAVPAVTVEPGGRMTFSGTASDDEGLRDVQISLRNTSTGEALGSDCTWGSGIQAGQCRISPVDINGSNYNWTYTTPFNLTPGTYSFTVRANDDEELTTSSTNQGRLTVNAQYAGDLAPNATMAFTAPTDKSLTIALSGAATDDIGVTSVKVSLQDRESGRYLQANGTMSTTVAWRDATLGTPNGTATTWSLPSITLPTGGDWRFTALAYDTRNQQDPSAATASYAVYPNDGPPTLNETLAQPGAGAVFNDGKIVVNGRAEDAPDNSASIASVQVGVVNSAGQWMGSNGTFTSTAASYRTAFLNSPGSTGSNYSYTTPVIPAGTYSVRVRPVDVHNQVGTEKISDGVVVNQPTNSPPVPSFTYTCNQNVCEFDGRASTDENPTSLTYSWSFGTQGSASGPLPTKTFTAPGTFPVTLTVKDEWQVSVASAPQNVTIAEPTGNSAPAPTFVQSCQGLTCSVSSQGTVDPNAGDTITYSWNWGDGTTPSTGASPAAHVYAASGSYTITLTTTDGWGKAASTTRAVSLTEPAGNTAPSVTFTASCTSFTTCQFNSAGTTDAQGDALRYAWSFGDGGTSTSTAPSRTYNTPGSYAVTLTVTDVWGKAASSTQTVNITEPVTNTKPTAVIASGSCTTFTTCAMSGVGSSDPDTAAGDGVRNYVWRWDDGTPDTTGTTASQSHVYNTAGTYTVTLTVLDKWGRASDPVTFAVTTLAEPAGNNPPTATFTTTCNARSCAVNSTGTSDADGGIRSYSWNWGDGTAVSTGASPAAHLYAAAGGYTITLTVTDNWGRTTTVTRQVTVA
ncbi:PKD domain-containing protein [Nocardioides anomalus]|uniref:PKD domain-containing protein n=1 Tax=Nocardioides anomalus TaxID=2712223 RepID=A0A6G6WGC8_9ACTN|nr:PKD domain-containing protein [Nocardioides anomalus]QIG44401.1 PKD domain-containing protein [Nocardioides anomalus]